MSGRNRLVKVETDESQGAARVGSPLSNSCRNDSLRLSALRLRVCERVRFTWPKNRLAGQVQRPSADLLLGFGAIVWNSADDCSESIHSPISSASTFMAAVSCM
jgi:hypothetical protein